MSLLWGFIEVFSIAALIVGLVYRFSKKNKENPAKRKKGKYIAIASVISIYVSALISSNYSTSESQKAEINDRKVTYEQLEKEISVLKKGKESLATDISQKESDLSNLESKHKDIVAAVANKDKIEQQISDNESKLEDVKSDIDDANNELESVNSQISSAKDELSTVKGEIKTAKSAPKTLSAGKFTVGKDIPEGRYKVVPNGGSGNFFVNGGQSVNIILGHGEFGESEYVFDAYDDDEIELTTSAKFIPIE